MAKRKLIGEAFKLQYDKGKLLSKIENDDPIILEGVIQRCNAKNGNGRIYTKEILKPEVDRYLKEFVETNRAWGELDHPDREVVEYKTSSHIIRELHWKGDDLVGKIEILPAEFFPCGKILRGALMIAGEVGFSSRGFGSESLISGETYGVNDDFFLICWDAVTNPSTHEAFGRLVEHKMDNQTYTRLMGEISNTVVSILK